MTSSQEARSAGAVTSSSVAEMSRDLSEQLEKRRSDWQRDVVRMQKDFFKDEIPAQCISDDDPRSAISAARTATSSGGAGSMYQFLADGSRVFRVRIDVSDFSPAELSVQVNGRGQLVVSGRGQSVSTSDHPHVGQRRRQFVKTIDLPDDVRADQLVSSLATDGILTVEAPVSSTSSRAQAPGRSRTTHDDDDDDVTADQAPLRADQLLSPMYQAATARTQVPGTSQVPGRSPGTTHDERLVDIARHVTAEPRSDSLQPSSQVINTERGLAVLRLVIELSRADFTAQDVHVVAYDSKLRVVARQEVTSSTGVTSRREFSRELDVTIPVRRSTWRAVLESRGDSARLWMAAVVIEGQRSVTLSDRDAAVAVSSVLPPDATPCHVELR